MTAKKNFFDAAAVFFLALAARSIIMISVLCNNTAIFFGWDTRNYQQLAENLLSKGNFIINENDPGIFRTPGYPAFLAFIYSKLGIDSLNVIIVQLVISSLSCVLLYCLLMRLFPRWIALTGSFLYIFDMPSIYYANKVLTETLFTFFFICFLFVFQIFFEKRKLRYLVCSAVLLGITVLIRPVTYYFIFAALILFALYFRRNIKKGIAYFLVFACLYCSIVMPWVIRNYSVSGYLGISAVQELNLSNFKGAWIEMKIRGEDDIYKMQQVMIQRLEDELKAKNMEDTALNRTLVRGRMGREILTAHPILLAKYQIIFILDVLYSTSMDLIAEIFDNDGLGRLMNLDWFQNVEIKYYIYLSVIYLFAVIGILAGLKRDKLYLFLPWIMILIYMLIIHGEFDGRSRFRVPMMPLIIIFTCLGIFETYKKLRTENIL